MSEGHVLLGPYRHKLTSRSEDGQSDRQQLIINVLTSISIVIPGVHVGDSSVSALWRAEEPMETRRVTAAKLQVTAGAAPPWNECYKTECPGDTLLSRSRYRTTLALFT